MTNSNWKPVPPIERDEEMDRTYIPLPGGWEIQTKGKGSTFRVWDGKAQQRWPIQDCEWGFGHADWERMARDIHAATYAAPVPTAAAQPVAVPDDYPWSQVPAWLDEAADDISEWGNYASTYFQNKHRLDSTVSDYRNRAKRLRELLATSQPSAQVPDDVDLWAFCRDVLKRGAAIESQFSQQGYETFIAEIEHAARKEDKRLRAMLVAAQQAAKEGGR